MDPFLFGKGMSMMIRQNSVYEKRSPEKSPEKTFKRSVTGPSEQNSTFQRAPMSTGPGDPVQGNSCGSIHHNTEIRGYGKSLGAHQMSETRHSANVSGGHRVGFGLPRPARLVSPDLMPDHTEGRFALSSTMCNSDAPEVPQYQLSTGGRERYQVPQTEIPVSNSYDSCEARQNEYAPSHTPPKQTTSARMVEYNGKSPRASNRKSRFSAIQPSRVVNKPKDKSRFETRPVADQEPSEESPVVNKPKAKSIFQTRPVADQEPSENTSLHEMSLACTYQPTYGYGTTLVKDAGLQQEFHEVGFKIDASPSNKSIYHSGTDGYQNQEFQYPAMPEHQYPTMLEHQYPIGYPSPRVNPRQFPGIAAGFHNPREWRAQSRIVDYGPSAPKDGNNGYRNTSAFQGIQPQDHGSYYTSPQPHEYAPQKDYTNFWMSNDQGVPPHKLEGEPESIQYLKKNRQSTCNSLLSGLELETKESKHGKKDCKLDLQQSHKM
jgi:hypothetical protein